MHGGILCLFLPNGGDCIVHGHQRPIGIFVRVGWECAGVVGAKEELTNSGLDSVAGQNHICFILGLVSEYQPDFALAVLLVSI
jgi:hypothetical protein